MALKPVLVLLLVALAVVSTHALTQGEETALLAFLDAWPSLGSASPPWNATVSLACTPPGFYGVECSYDEDPHVTSLELNDINITGTIPREVVDFQWLQVLSFERSCLSNALSAELYQLDNLASYTVTDLPVLCDELSSRNATYINGTAIMKRMENLTIVMASLNGLIPPIIENYPHLQRLRLSSLYTPGTRPTHGPLTGLIPQIGRLRTLKSLRLENLNLQGADPPEGQFPDSLEEFSIAGSTEFWMKLETLLLSCPKLRYLDISGAFATLLSLNLTDPLPNLQYLYARSSPGYFPVPSLFWSLFPNMREMAITGANAVGTLSADIGYMKDLELLDLSDSSFSGVIPPSIGNCTSLSKLVLKKMRLKGTIPTSLCQLSATLNHLEISDVKTGGSTIPDCIGNLTALELLYLQSNGHIGTIPSSIGHLPHILAVHLGHNALTGELPDTSSRSLHVVDVQNNRLTGPIPASLATCAAHLTLSYNFLSGTIPPGLFMASKVTTFDISHNDFSGPLPRFPDWHVPSLIDASHNSFEGAVPEEYRRGNNLELSFNALTSLAPFLNGSGDHSNVTILSVGDNLLYEDTGDQLDFRHFPRMTSLSLRNNQFYQLLPLLPKGIEYFDGSNNRFKLDHFFDWEFGIKQDSLTYLDLSSNHFSFASPYYADLVFFGSNLAYLSLAHNDLQRMVSFFPTTPRPSLTVLDLTDTELGSDVPSFRVFPNLGILKIGSNDFAGDLELEALLSVVQLDISFNRFEFDASKFSSMPRLVSLTANNNRIHGALVLDNMPNLQSANFSSNSLDQQPDLVTIGSAVRQSQLRVIDISKNPLPTISSFDTDRTGLTRSSSSSPSNVSADSVTCYALTFWNQSNQFAFDEDLFDYAQCECSQGYFGAPPYQCIKCPSHGTSFCGLSSAWISSGAFMYIVGNATSSPATPVPKPTSGSSSSILQNFADTLEDAFPTLFTTLFGETPSLSTPNLSSVVLATESCLLTAVQTQSGRSNCEGALITGDWFDLPGFDLPSTLDAQCAEGSAGRLCSRCVCDPHANDTSCWFESGARCTKCRRVFPLSTSLPVFFALVLIAVIVLSIIMAIILRRRRNQSRVRFADLSLLKRIFYRLMYLKTLGNLSILITFVQILVAFTGWDATARLSFLALLNGKTNGLGLRCLFPILSNPLWSQLVELSVPFVVSFIIALSVLIGGIAASLKFKSSKSDLKDDSIISEDTHLLTAKQKVAVEYPTTALATSLVITVVKFFYFGTALTAHEYLFSNQQAATGIRYIQSNPWMKSADARTLIVASIPAILIFDLVIPLCFVVVCWRVRNTFRQPSVQIYYGSIFETYRDGCFWWEIVNTLKKLAIALVLKALPPTDAVQSTLIVTILAGSTLVQLSVSPWKRKIENVSDGLSSLLLAGALLATRPGSLEHMSGVLWYLWVLSLIFIIGSVGILILQTVTGRTEYEKMVDDFEQADVANGGMKAIEEGNMTDSWHLLDSPLNS